jgi:opacity protein-like surface antigen
MMYWKKSLLFVLTFITINVANAAEPKAVIFGDYVTGDGDFIDTGTKTSFDVDGYNFGGRFYASDNVAIGISVGNNTFDFLTQGLTAEIDADATSVGIAYVFGGRVDTWTGEGSEHRLGITYTDAEATLTVPAAGLSQKTDDDGWDIGYIFEQGLGNGFIANANAAISAEDLFDELTLGLGISKALSESLSVGLNYSYVEVDETPTDEGLEGSILFFTLQVNI